MGAPILIQSASLFGMYAVTFVMTVFANTVAMALRFNRDTAAAIGVGVAICAANLVSGIIRFAQPQPDTLRVAAIVDETAVAASWRAHSLASDLAVMATYAQEIRRAAREGARFVVTSVIRCLAWRTASPGVMSRAAYSSRSRLA
ncbi:MAG TPA: hypothetical protein VHV80_13705 [Steroidobacteraceae bacterium]|jgi:apolipoprotein N-acyltransferase|nr:hypothetical protein [Steroidobacteraceae bacterium]